MRGTALLSLASTGPASQQYTTNGDLSATIQAYMAVGSWGSAVIKLQGSTDRSSWSDTGTTLTGVGTSTEASIAAYTYIRAYVDTAQAGATAVVTLATFTTTGYATIPLSLADLSPTGAANGDVVTLDAGVWTYATPSAGGVFSDSKQVTMTGNSGTATITNASITTTSIITASIVGVAKSGTGSEDYIAEELSVYTTNQLNGSVDVVILSPNFHSTNTYQVNIFGA